MIYFTKFSDDEKPEMQIYQSNLAAVCHLMIGTFEHYILP